MKDKTKQNELKNCRNNNNESNINYYGPIKFCLIFLNYYLVEFYYHYYHNDKFVF